MKKEMINDCFSLEQTERPHLAPLKNVKKWLPTSKILLCLFSSTVTVALPVSPLPAIAPLIFCLQLNFRKKVRIKCSIKSDDLFLRSLRFWDENSFHFVLN